MSRDPPKPTKRPPKKRRTNFRCADVRLFDRVRAATIEAAPAQGLTRCEMAVLVYLASLWGEPRARAIGFCNPSVLAIANATGVDAAECTVRRATAILAKKKLIYPSRNDRHQTKKYFPIWNIGQLEREHAEMVRQERDAARIADAVRAGRLIPGTEPRTSRIPPADLRPVHIPPPLPIAAPAPPAMSAAEQEAARRHRELAEIEIAEQAAASAKPDFARDHLLAYRLARAIGNAGMAPADFPEVGTMTNRQVGLLVEALEAHWREVAKVSTADLIQGIHPAKAAGS